MAGEGGRRLPGAADPMTRTWHLDHLDGWRADLVEHPDGYRYHRRRRNTARIWRAVRSDIEEAIATRLAHHHRTAPHRMPHHQPGAAGMSDLAARPPRTWRDVQAARPDPVRQRSQSLARNPQRRTSAHGRRHRPLKGNPPLKSTAAATNQDAPREGTCGWPTDRPATAAPATSIGSCQHERTAARARAHDQHDRTSSSSSAQIRTEPIVAEPNTPSAAPDATTASCPCSAPTRPNTAPPSAIATTMPLRPA